MCSCSSWRMCTNLVAVHRLDLHSAAPATATVRVTRAGTVLAFARRGAASSRVGHRRRGPLAGRSAARDHREVQLAQPRHQQLHLRAGAAGGPHTTAKTWSVCVKELPRLANTIMAGVPGLVCVPVSCPQGDYSDMWPGLTTISDLAQPPKMAQPQKRPPAAPTRQAGHLRRVGRDDADVARPAEPGRAAASTCCAWSRPPSPPRPCSP
jgi:hypothetical protein